MPADSSTIAIPRRTWLAVILVIFAMTCLPALVGSEGPKQAQAQPVGESTRWSTLITPAELAERLSRDATLVIDVRSAREYALGHIEGAINIPGDQWRTPATKNPATDRVGQRVFRNEMGEIDVAR